MKPIYTITELKDLADLFKGRAESIARMLPLVSDQTTRTAKLAEAAVWMHACNIVLRTILDEKKEPIIYTAPGEDDYEHN